MARRKGFAVTLGLLTLTAVLLPTGTVVAQDAPPPGSTGIYFEVIPATPTGTPSPTASPSSVPSPRPTSSPSSGPLPVTGERGHPWLIAVAVALIVLGGLVAVVARRPRRP